MGTEDLFKIHRKRGKSDWFSLSDLTYSEIRGKMSSSSTSEEGFEQRHAFLFFKHVQTLNPQFTTAVWKNWDAVFVRVAAFLAPLDHGFSTNYWRAAKLGSDSYFTHFCFSRYMSLVVSQLSLIANERKLFGVTQRLVVWCCYGCLMLMRKIQSTYDLVHSCSCWMS